MSAVTQTLAEKAAVLQSDMCMRFWMRNVRYDNRQWLYLHAMNAVAAVQYEAYDIENILWRRQQQQHPIVLQACVLGQSKMLSKACCCALYSCCNVLRLCAQYCVLNAICSAAFAPARLIAPCPVLALWR